MKKRVGILTSGGDCPGLNATIRGVAKALYARMGDSVEIVGILNGYHGLITGDYKEMTEDDFRGILTLGGTILGTKRTPLEKIKLEIQEKERQTLLANLQKKQKGIQNEIRKKKRSAEQLNAQIDRLIEIEIEKARKRAEEEARRKAAAEAAAKAAAAKKAENKTMSFLSDHHKADRRHPL